MAEEAPSQRVLFRRRFRDMNILELTAQEIGEKLSLEKGDYYGLVGFLETRGLIKPVGTRKAEGAKGRGATVYAVDRNLPELVKQMLEQLFV